MTVPLQRYTQKIGWHVRLCSLQAACPHASLARAKGDFYSDADNAESSRPLELHHPVSGFWRCW